MLSVARAECSQKHTKNKQKQMREDRQRLEIQVCPFFLHCLTLETPSPLPRPTLHTQLRETQNSNLALANEINEFKEERKRTLENLMKQGLDRNEMHSKLQELVDRVKQLERRSGGGHRGNIRGGGKHQSTSAAGSEEKEEFVGNNLVFTRAEYKSALTALVSPFINVGEGGKVAVCSPSIRAMLGRVSKDVGLVIGPKFLSTANFWSINIRTDKEVICRNCLWGEHGFIHAIGIMPANGLHMPFDYTKDVCFSALRNRVIRMIVENCSLTVFLGEFKFFTKKLVPSVEYNVVISFCACCEQQFTIL